MSKDAIKAFMTEVGSDTGLAGRMRSAVETHDGPDAVEAIAALARDSGFDVEVRDVEAFRERALALLDDGEMRDDQLESVSGGVMVVDDIILGLGAVAVVGGVAALFATSDEGRDFFSRW